MSEEPAEGKAKYKRVLLSVHPSVGIIDDIRMYRGEKILAVAKRIAEKDLDPRLSAPLAVDVFYTYYLPVPLVSEGSENEDKDMMFRRAIVSAMLRTDSLWKSKTFTTADGLTSVVASASFIERLSKLLPPPEGSGEGGQQKQQQEQQEQEGPESGPPNIQEAVQKAMESAMRDSEMAKKIKMTAERLGAGKGSVFSLESSAELVLRLARETDVARILEKIEGLKLPSVKGSSSTKFSKGWIAGIEYGGDI